MEILFWLSIGLDWRTPSKHLLTAMIDALYKKGHTVHILQKDTGGKNRELYPELKALGVTTTRIPMASVSHGNLVSRYLSDVHYVRKCAKWMNANRGFDRVFLQSSNVAGFQMRVLRRQKLTLSWSVKVVTVFIIPNFSLWIRTGINFLIQRKSFIIRIL